MKCVRRARRVRRADSVGERSDSVGVGAEGWDDESVEERGRGGGESGMFPSRNSETRYSRMNWGGNRMISPLRLRSSQFRAVSHSAFIVSRSSAVGAMLSFPRSASGTK